jgi:hypothetical protein
MSAARTSPVVVTVGPPETVTPTGTSRATASTVKLPVVAICGSVTVRPAAV